MTNADDQFLLIKSRLAQNVKSLRAELGLSQEQLALDAGVDRTYVSQLERAIINPSLLVLVKLSLRLEVDVVDLLQSHDQSKANSARRS